MEFSEIHASCRLKKVKELQMCIAQAIRNRMTGSLHNRRRLAKCLSRVRGNSHARFLGGSGLRDSPRLPGVLYPYLLTTLMKGV